MAKITFLFTLFMVFLVSVNCKLLDHHPNTKSGEDFTEFEDDHSFRAHSKRDNVVEDIVFRYYNGKTVDEYVEVKYTEAMNLLIQNGFNKNSPTVFYIHGYKETADKESVKTVVDAYLKAQPNTNKVLIDWSNMAMGSYYVNAAPNTRKVAYAVALVMSRWIQAGLKMEDIHIVGHSLGGQTAGFIGREIQKLRVTLKRITALDPAFPQFYPGYALSHIMSSDAEFVDVIHTDPGRYGAPVNTGTVDFYPNCWKHPLPLEFLQPGCPRGDHPPLSDDDLCSHWRSWRFWAESVINPGAFPAVQRDHDAVRNTHMGIRASKGIYGKYILNTKATSPFDMGMDGIPKN